MLAKKLIKNVRIIILLVFIVLALVAIRPNPDNDGMSIRSVMKNSSASLAGIENPKPTATPMSRERIVYINKKPVVTEQDYYSAISDLVPNSTLQLTTNKKSYRLVVLPKFNITYLDEYENVTKEIETEVNKTINGTITLVNETKNITTLERKKLVEVLGAENIGLRVHVAPKTNIKKGLDLQGGTRVLLQPEKEVSQQDMESIISNLQERLNVFGLTDVIVREAGDLSGNQYILVEIAGSNEEEVRELLAKQGKFEAKVGNKTVFQGGKDITYVCRTADCSGIDPQSGCRQSSQNQWFCRFRFSISLTPSAAKTQAAATRDLETITEESGEEYLSEKLLLFLDNNKVDELNIGASLKGRAETEIMISGSGTGTTQQDAIFNSLNNMKRLQTILITGSLPVKMNVVKADTISPVLGKEFVKSSWIMGLIAILAVSFVVFLRYREWRVAVPMMFTMVSEVVILLGIASLIQWNLDLAAIAGIIVAVGTGVDDQIVITDETLSKGGRKYNWKEKLKRAFFIIMGAYFTTVVAMIPLLFAGAGLVKGFALTTIIGISIGVFVTRPAYAAVVEILLKK